MAKRQTGRDRFKVRPFIDTDGFRWWLEEDPAHWDRSLTERI